jgi:hypothetical protein
MEFDIGNILYIIITLVAISLGLLGRKKKQQPGGGPAAEEGESQPGFLENLERTLSKLGQEERAVVDLREYEQDLPPEEVDLEPVVESDPNPEPVIPTMADSYDQIMERLSQGEAAWNLSEEQVSTEPLEVIDLEMEEGVDYFQVVKDFNAGTAVVYSAIINRLDY